MPRVHIPTKRARQQHQTLVLVGWARGMTQRRTSNLPSHGVWRRRSTYIPDRTTHRRVRINNSQGNKSDTRRQRHATRQVTNNTAQLLFILSVTSISIRPALRSSGPGVVYRRHVHSAASCRVSSIHKLPSTTRASHSEGPSLGGELPSSCSASPP